MNFKWVIVLPIIFFALVSTAQAASLYIDPGTATLYRGDAITTSVRLMPDQANGECINTADVVISYTDSIQPVDVSIGRSILSVWVESPVINKENRTITFAGGIPNGYCGRVQGDPGLTNVLVDIIFRSPGLQIGATDGGDTATIDFSSETRLYLNDGQGTEASLRTVPTVLTLEKSAGPGIVDEWRQDVRDDNIPPEGFSIELQKDPTGLYYIIAQTTDKQTGISHYEIMEEPIEELRAFNWGATDAPWVRMENNYHHTLSDQTLNSTIRVRAYDKAGNDYVATYVPEVSLRTVSRAEIYSYAFIAAASVLLIILVVIVVVIVRRRIARRVEPVLQDDEEEIV